MRLALLTLWVLLVAVVVARTLQPPAVHVHVTVVAPAGEDAADDEDDLDADTPFTGNTLHLETL